MIAFLNQNIRRYQVKSVKCPCQCTERLNTYLTFLPHVRQNSHSYPHLCALKTGQCKSNQVFIIQLILLKVQYIFRQQFQVKNFTVCLNGSMERKIPKEDTLTTFMLALTFLILYPYAGFFSNVKKTTVSHGNCRIIYQIKVI